ncbi:hypothetical protein KAR91_81910 [Candidatus Pacearchaeota archaeon]|nr:hypothetical protein [Candidatus Pacearchaeota archaeon]
MAELQCQHRKRKAKSKHPELEPPCLFVYMFMSDGEKEEDSKRAIEKIRRLINE